MKQTQMNSTRRTHVVLSRDLLAQLNHLVRPRQRSLFIEQAIREKLTREQQRKALKESAGVLNLADHPEWSTPEKVSAWVRTLRAEADENSVRTVRNR